MVSENSEAQASMTPEMEALLEGWRLNFLVDVNSAVDQMVAQNTGIATVGRSRPGTGERISMVVAALGSEGVERLLKAIATEFGIAAEVLIVGETPNFASPAAVAQTESADSGKSPCDEASSAFAELLAIFDDDDDEDEEDDEEDEDDYDDDDEEDDEDDDDDE